MKLTQRLYLAIFISIILVAFVIGSLLFSWQTVDISLARFEYTQQVGVRVDLLEQTLFTRNFPSFKSKPEKWLSDHKVFTEILLTAPSLTPAMQTFQNSLMSENESLSMLYQQLNAIDEKQLSTTVKMHLMERFLIQVESIRESCRQLAALVNADLKEVIKQEFYLTSVVLILGIICLYWGSYIFARLFNSSIRDIQNGIDEVNSGHYRKIKLAYKSAEFSSFVGKFNEMTEQLNKTTVSRDKCKKMVEDRTFELRKLSTTDQLTGIANRRALFDRGAMEFFRVARHGGSLSLLVLDCDLFKNINDTYGHLIGDKVLQHICQVCEKQVRQVDLLARYGGEEFVVLLSNCTINGAEESAKRIALSLAENPLVIDGKSIKVTVSIGVATILVNHSSFEQLLNDADKAMYIAKEKGRNRIELFAPR